MDARRGSIFSSSIGPYTRKKSDSTATAPFDDLIAPIWFGWTDILDRALAAQPKRHFTLLMHTNLGTPRSHKDAASWFSRVRNADDLPHLSSLGIRKYRAAIFKENGATSEQPMAILSEESKNEAERYSKPADLRIVITNG